MPTTQQEIYVVSTSDDHVPFVATHSIEEAELYILEGKDISDYTKIEEDERGGAIINLCYDSGTVYQRFFCDKITLISSES
jgi:hypothetical protein